MMKMWVLMLSLLLLLTGCKNQESVTVTYDDARPSLFLDGEEYQIFRQDITSMVREKRTQEIYPLLYDPLNPEDDGFHAASKWKFYGNTVYYQCKNRIEKLNLDTFEHSILYTEVLPTLSFDLFGVTLWQNKIPAEYIGGDTMRDFLLVNDKLIIIRQENLSVYSKGKERSVYDGQINHYAGMPYGVFFTDDLNQIHFLKSDTWAEKTMPPIYASCLTVSNENLYYIDQRDGYCVKAYDPITGESEKRVSGKWKKVMAEGEYLLLKGDTGAFFTATSDGKQLVELPEIPVAGNVTFLNNGKTILIYSHSAGNDHSHQIIENPLSIR